MNGTILIPVVGLTRAATTKTTKSNTSTGTCSTEHPGKARSVCVVPCNFHYALNIDIRILKFFKKNNVQSHPRPTPFQFEFEFGFGISDSKLLFAAMRGEFGIWYHYS